MRDSLSSPPIFKEGIPFDGIVPELEDIGFTPRELSYRPEPGERAAIDRLDSFLERDSKEYRWAISSPVLSVKHGSGLSPYFSSGSLSMRRAVQKTNSRIDWIRKNKSQVEGHGEWIKSLSSFRRRLAWRCHFIQKFDDQPNIEFFNINNGNVPMLVRAIIALSVFYGAYIAEVFRAGIESVPQGQREGGASLGLSDRQVMRHIVLPQAFRNMLPALGNDFISMMKDSSLLSVLAVEDLTYRGRLYSGSTFRFAETYLVLTVMYLIITLILSGLQRRLEKRLESK